MATSISVVIQSSVTATVTRVPGVLSRLIPGVRESTVWVQRIRVLGAGYRWIHDDHREVEPEVADAIDRAITMRAVRERRAQLVRR